MMVLLHFHLDIIKYKFMLLIYMSISANTKQVLLENLYYSPNTQYTSIKSL